ncbi:hypothetical protein AVEN_206912-1 [Araneus ventricosus]|uniref:Uncharacterized protein n=1 Tax=Araneus ventricosus TaxID=182803 RepID=A0A4Y2PFX6_ARAVE|nr:hypothetical protein AVEN_206912-1 [Araneus ventricosus]
MVKIIYLSFEVTTALVAPPSGVKSTIARTRVLRKFISIANACRVVPSNWPKKGKGEWLLRRILNHLSESCTAERGLRQGDSLTCLQQTKQLRSRTLNVDVQRALETFERKGKENYIRACTRTRVLANQI